MKKITFLSIYLCLSASQPFRHIPPGLRRANTPSGNPVFSVNSQNLEEIDTNIEQAYVEKQQVQTRNLEVSGKKGNKIWKKVNYFDQTQDKRQPSHSSDDLTGFINAQVPQVIEQAAPMQPHSPIQIEYTFDQPQYTPSSTSYIYHTHSTDQDDNIIHGQPNYIENGHQNYIQGRYNEIYNGDLNQIIGSQNRIHNGDGNYIRGTGNLIMGSSNRVDSNSY